MMNDKNSEEYLLSKLKNFKICDEGYSRSQLESWGNLFLKYSTTDFNHEYLFTICSILRNYCGLQEDARSTILKNSELCCRLKDYALQCKSLPAFQLIANMSIRLDESSAHLYVRRFEELMTSVIHFSHPEESSKPAIMILFNFWRGNPKFFKELPNSDKIELLRTLKKEVQRENEFALLLTELMFELESDLIIKIIDDFETLKIEFDTVQFILESLLSFAEKKHFNFIPETFIASMCPKIEEFMSEEKVYSESKITVLSYFIEFIAIVSADDNLRQKLNLDFLLENAVSFLKYIHLKGKNGDELYAPVKKLSELNKTISDVSKNPLFSAKSLLIRFIGNIAYNNKSSQDKIRSLDGIPLILDCCSIDAKNPFILQWAILAIRNICYQNEDNQNVIRNMSQQRVIDAKILQEAGITLDAHESGKLVMAPLNLSEKTNGTTE